MIGEYRKQTYILPFMIGLAFTLVHSMRSIANRFSSSINRCRSTAHIKNTVCQLSNPCLHSHTSTHLLFRERWPGSWTTDEYTSMNIFLFIRMNCVNAQGKYLLHQSFSSIRNVTLHFWNEFMMSVSTERALTYHLAGHDDGDVRLGYGMLMSRAACAFH